MVGLRESSIVPFGAACVCWGRGQVLDVAAGTKFPTEHLIVSGRYSPKQICIVDEIRLLWKRMGSLPVHSKFIKIYGKSMQTEPVDIQV